MLFVVIDFGFMVAQPAVRSKIKAFKEKIITGAKAVTIFIGIGISVKFLIHCCLSGSPDCSNAVIHLSGGVVIRPSDCSDAIDVKLAIIIGAVKRNTIPVYIRVAGIIVPANIPYTSKSNPSSFVVESLSPVV